jgi:hypothetical protein
LYQEGPAVAIDPQQLQALQDMYEGAGSLQLKDIENRYKLGTAQLSNAYKIAQLQAGTQEDQIAATRQYQQGLLAQAAAEMQQVGIPQMLINKYTAEKNYEIAQATLDAQKEQSLRQFGLDQSAVTGVYNGQQTQAAQLQAANIAAQQAGLTGTFQGQQTLAAQKQAADIAAQQAGLTGTYNGQLTEAAREFQQQFGLNQAGVTGMYGGQQTEAAREAQRQYNLQVAQYGTQLASTPDQYFQAQRFAQMAPRLQGDTAGVTFGGAPTPQISRMGQLLGQGAGGYDPSMYGGAGGGYGYAGGAPIGGGNQHELAVQSGVGGGGGPYPSYLDPRLRAQFDAMPDAMKQQYLQADAANQTPAAQQQQAALDAAHRVPGGYRAYGGGGVDQGGAMGNAATARGGGYGAGYGADRSAQYGYGAGPSGDYGYGGGAMGNAVTAQGGGYGAGYGQQADDRAKQIGQVAKASPPSPYDGLSDQDASTLKLMESIYKKGGQGVAGGEMERLKASGNLGFMESAGKLLGYDPSQFEATYSAYRPSQGAGSLAG